MGSSVTLSLQHMTGEIILKIYFILSVIKPYYVGMKNKNFNSKLVHRNNKEYYYSNKDRKTNNGASKEQRCIHS